MQVKKQQLEPDTEQRTGSTLGKEYVKAVYCHPGYSVFPFVPCPWLLLVILNIFKTGNLLLVDLLYKK